MAKVALNKLNLKPNIENKEILWNEQSIEIKQYLPIEDKLDLISTIINKSLDDNSYYNSARIEIFIKLETIMAYSNISFTEKQKENIFKLYDLFSGDLGDEIINTIPESERNFIISITYQIIEGIYKYKNSIMGIMDVLASDYSDLDFNATEIQKKIGDPQNLELLKSVLTKLG